MDCSCTNMECEAFNITDISNMRYHINILQAICTCRMYTEFRSVYNIYSLYIKYSINIILILAICAFASISRFLFLVFRVHFSTPRFPSAI